VFAFHRHTQHTADNAFGKTGASKSYSSNDGLALMKKFTSVHIFSKPQRLKNFFRTPTHLQAAAAVHFPFYEENSNKVRSVQ